MPHKKKKKKNSDGKCLSCSQWFHESPDLRCEIYPPRTWYLSLFVSTLSPLIQFIAFFVLIKFIPDYFIVFICFVNRIFLFPFLIIAISEQKGYSLILYIYMYIQHISFIKISWILNGFFNNLSSFLRIISIFWKQRLFGGFFIPTCILLVELSKTFEQCWTILVAMGTLLSLNCWKHFTPSCFVYSL